MKTILAKLDQLLALVVRLLGWLFITGVVTLWLLVIVGVVGNLKKLL